MVRVALFLLLMLLSAGTSHAVVTVDFSGVITRFEFDGPGIPLGPVFEATFPVGSMFSGSFTYDETVQGSEGFFVNSGVFPDGTLSAFSVTTSSGYTASIAESSGLRVFDDVMDTLFFESSATGPAVGGLLLDFIGMDLVGSFLPNATTLPPSLDLSQISDGEIVLDFPDPVTFGLGAAVFGTITELTTVPEPTTSVLLFTGTGGLIGLTAFRRRTEVARRRGVSR